MLSGPAASPFDEDRHISSNETVSTMNKEQMQRLGSARRKVQELRGYL